MQNKNLNDSKKTNTNNKVDDRFSSESLLQAFMKDSLKRMESNKNIDK